MRTSWTSIFRMLSLLLSIVASLTQTCLKRLAPFHFKRKKCSFFLCLILKLMYGDTTFLDLGGQPIFLGFNLGSNFPWLTSSWNLQLRSGNMYIKNTVAWNIVTIYNTINFKGCEGFCLSHLRRYLCKKQECSSFLCFILWKWNSCRYAWQKRYFDNGALFQKGVGEPTLFSYVCMI